MATTTRKTHHDSTRTGLGGFVRMLQATRAQRAQDPERAERRRVGRELAAYPAPRGVGLTVPYRDAPR